MFGLTKKDEEKDILERLIEGHRVEGRVDEFIEGTIEDVITHGRMKALELAERADNGMMMKKLVEEVLEDSDDTINGIAGVGIVMLSIAERGEIEGMARAATDLVDCAVRIRLLKRTTELTDEQAFELGEELMQDLEF